MTGGELSDTPASPQARRVATPGWLDGRLVLGVLLVLVSVVVGARVLAGADRSQLVWAATDELTAGSQLEADDLVPVRVRLFESGPRYLGADGAPPVGWVVSRGVGSGELLPEGSLVSPGEDVDFRLVTVPVEVGHYPPSLRAEQRVDLWVTPDALPSGGRPTPAPTSDPAGTGQGAGDLQSGAGARQVLSSVRVSTAPVRGELASAGSAVPIVLQVRPDEVAEVVAAMALGRLDVVEVPREAEDAGDLAAPAAAG
jgi:hypothetical protein